MPRRREKGFRFIIPDRKTKWSCTIIERISEEQDQSMLVDLTSQYKLDGNSDDSIGSNNGTDTDISYTTGIINLGANFNGSSSRIRLIDSNVLISDDDKWSITLWLKADTIVAGVHTQHAITFHRLATSNTAIAITTGVNDRLSMAWSNNDTFTLLETISTGTWYHIAITFDGTIFRGYVNGETPTTFTKADAGYDGIGSFDAFIGSKNTTQKFFDGIIDDVRIYNKTLSATEISNIYNAGAEIGTDVSDYTLSGTFTRGVIGEENGCEIELDNSGKLYTDSFKAGDIIKFKMDFIGGTTVQWKGILEQRTNKFGAAGYTINIKGSHYTSALLDITVTEEFVGATISDILKSIIDTYLTGYTYTNVTTIDTTVNVKWINKPFFDCVVDLMNLGDVDCYLDNDKDFHLFSKNSKQIKNEAIWEDDALIELKGLGTDSVDVRNKITTTGEADRLIVLWTPQDSTSQDTYGIKEKVITDTSITDESVAQQVGEAELAQIKNPATKGSANCIFLPNLYPGCSVHVRSQPHKIHDFYRVIKYTHQVPNEITEVIFSQERGISKLFKERIQKDMGQERIQNPFKMLYSYNFTFDNYTKIDEASSNNIKVEDGKLKLITGVTGTMISNAKETPANVIKVSLQVIGEALSGTKYYIDIDGTDTFAQEITQDTEETVDSTGTDLKLKIVINSASTAIDACVLLFK